MTELLTRAENRTETGKVMLLRGAVHILGFLQQYTASFASVFKNNLHSEKHHRRRTNMIAGIYPADRVPMSTDGMSEYKNAKGLELIPAEYVS